MVRRLPAGPAICWLQGNACFPKVFKESGAAVAGSSGLLGRRQGDAFEKKTNGNPSFPERPAVRVSATQGRSHLEVAQCFSTAQAH